MSAGDILLWVIFPYAAVAVFFTGLWWRYRFDQFGWTSGSTQIFEQRILGVDRDDAERVIDEMRADVDG